MDFKPQRVHFSGDEAVAFKQRYIDKWTPVSDVWALRFGDEILGALCTFGSLYITHFFRKELKIRPYAPITCYLPVLGVSAVAVTAFQAATITKNILNKDTCPTCIVAKGGIGQMLSLGYTLFAAPVVCFYMADRLLTYPVPPLLRAPKEVFTIYRNIIKKYARPLYFIGAVYLISSCFITSQKYQNLKTIDLKIRA